MASSREERLQMRQRGAGTRKVQEVDFGFSFGLPVAAAPAPSIDQVVQQPETQTQTSTPTPTPTPTQKQTPPQTRKEAIRATTQSPRHSPRSPRTKQTPRLSAAHVAADEDQGRSSKRRRIGPRNDDSNNSPRSRNDTAVATTNEEPAVSKSQQAQKTQDTAETTTNAETQKDSPVTHNQEANPPTPTEEPEASAKPKRGRRKSSAPKATQPAPEEAPEESPSARERQNSAATKATRVRQQTDNTQPIESEPTRSRQGSRPAADKPENATQPEPKRKRRARTSQVTTTVDTSPKETGSGRSKRQRQQAAQAAEPEPEPRPVEAEDENESMQPKRKRRKSVKSAEREPEPAEEPEEEPEPEPEPIRTKKRKGKQRASEDDAQEVPVRTQDDRSQDQAEPSAAESAQPPKRRRVRPSAATASEPSTRRRRSSEEGREDGGERRRDGTVAITVHRLADTRALDTNSDASDETDGLDTRKTFPRRAGVNAADVLAQICQEIVDKHLTGLSNSVANESNQAKRSEAGRQRKAVEAYNNQLQERLFELSELLESNFALGVKLKKAKRETTEMRNRLLEVRRQRHEVALRMDAVRQKHSAEESAKMSRNAINNSLHQLESTLERGRARPGEGTGNEDDGIAGLEFTLRTVAEDVSSAAEGSHGGLLGQVRAFNAQLETAARALGL
ncbi:Zinc finger CCCH domain-containing protein 13 [Talaromyces islandicus]|uniref:Zinc finger CCCH domain-containing protein 13 n=1 Tax=Talaromyces islandicus TaxID=28573 RepID=A0A0U1M384_TALIS|nr:Zinc finger CCCH domain-containing protein 13 [Talaromyces islandicus]